MKEWLRIPAEQVCELVVDCLHGTAPLAGHETPYRMVRTTNIKNGRFDFTDARYVEQSTYEHWTKRVSPRCGDVLLTREAPVGEVAIIRDDQPLFLGQRIVLYRADRSVLLPEYLCYAMQAPEVQHRLHASGTGATVAHVNMKDARTLRIPVPSMATQERIAGVLAAYDDLIATNERRMALLEESVHLLYREWFERLRFPGHERTTVCDGVPDGWRRARFGDLVSVRTERVEPDAIEPVTPYVGLEHMPRRSIALAEWGEASDVGSTKLRFSLGDVLFGKIRPYFHKVVVAPIDGITSSDAIVLRTADQQLFGLVVAIASSSAFVEHASNTGRIGTRMPRAEWRTMADYPVLVPSNAVATEFTDIVKARTDLIAGLVHTNRKLRQARDYLLPRLLSGQLTV